MWIALLLPLVVMILTLGIERMEARVVGQRTVRFAPEPRTVRFKPVERTVRFAPVRRESGRPPR